MDRIRARKIYLDYLDSLNESKSREKKINKTVKRINNFLNNELIINWLIKKVVSVDSSDGVKYLVWFADRVKNYILDYVEGYFRGTDQVYFNDEASKAFGKSMGLYLKHGEVTDEIVKIITELYEIEKTKFKEDEDVNLLYAWFEYSAGKNLKKNIENELDEFLMRSQDWLESEEPITTIVDWLKTPLRSDEETDLSQYKTYADAWNVADEWHKNLKAGGIIEDESGYIFKKYDDGWYWIDLRTTISDDEAEAMGHCGTTNEGTTLLSLRKSRSPHVTMAINSEDGSVTQCKGKNSIPEPRKVFVNGQLDEMKVSKGKLGLQTEQGFVLVNVKNKSIISDIVSFMGKEVTISGIAHFKPNGQLSFVEIEEFSEPGKTDKFFSKKPNAMTAKQQLLFQVKLQKKSSSFEALKGISGLLKDDISDEQFNEMLKDVRR